jgi:hypothetical protein
MLEYWDSGILELKAKKLRRFEDEKNKMEILIL